MHKTNFSKVFARRATECFFMILLLFLSCVLRIGVINTKGYGEVAAKQSGYRISVSHIRGTIYDCNLKPLTNTTYETYAAISPTPSGITGISSKISKEDLSQVISSLKANKPAVCKVKENFTHTGIATASICSKYSSYLDAAHILGYTDASCHGVCGLQKAYDSLLYSDKSVDAVFTTDGKGSVLEGIEPYFENVGENNLNCLVTTLESDIQSLVSRCADKIEKGAVIVSECKTGKIRATVSRPDYNAAYINKYLYNENSPMINRALLSFSVGSVFKPCVAAAAIESKNYGFTHFCSGSTVIGDRVFKCHKEGGHGAVDLRLALAYSCNSFFYNFIQNIGANAVYNMASSLNFGREIKIADNFYTSGAVLTDISALNSEASLANLSIGQGNLSASPVCMLNLYNAIASDGGYFLPSVVERTVKDGKSEKYSAGAKTKVMSESTAKILREYLSAVISEGTGKSAAPKKVTAAGKTATAQTGRYSDDGTEINNSWFCGFFPLENPEYTVIIMSEKGTTNEVCRTFCEIADGIYELQNK